MRSPTSPACVVNSRGRDPLRSVTRVSLRSYRAAPILGGFDLDQLLQHQLHSVTDQINSLPGTERVQQLGQRVERDRCLA